MLPILLTVAALGVCGLTWYLVGPDIRRYIRIRNM